MHPTLQTQGRAASPAVAVWPWTNHTRCFGSRLIKTLREFRDGSSRTVAFVSNAGCTSFLSVLDYKVWATERVQEVSV